MLRILRQITFSVPPSITYVNGFPIEDSAKPHSIWGMEGTEFFHRDKSITESPMVPQLTSHLYAPSVTNVITVTAQNQNPAPKSIPKIYFPPSSQISNQQQLHLQKQYTNQSSQQGISNVFFEENSSDSDDNRQLNEGSNKKRKRNQQSASSDIATLPIFQHRLFEGIINVGKDDDSDTMENDMRWTNKKNDNKEYSSEDDSEESEVDSVVQFDNNVEPKDRIRVARSQDGSRTSVRVTGGWMIYDDDDDDNNVTGKDYKAAHDTNKNVVNPVNEISEVILKEKAAAKLLENNVALGRRYKLELIENAVGLAYSQPSRKRSFPSGGRASTFVESKENAALERPMIGLLPLEDGGLRSACISCAIVPKSLHNACISQSLCGYCMTPLELSAINPPSKSKSKKLKSNAKKENAAAGDDQIVCGVVEKKIGIITYVLHTQCASAIAKYILEIPDDDDDDNNDADEIESIDAKEKEIIINHTEDEIVKKEKMKNKMQRVEQKYLSSARAATEEEIAADNRYLNITLGTIYEYEEIDDCLCDLCGRAGGLMQFFHIDESCTSMKSPSPEGWLAHSPCIFWLAESRLLQIPFTRAQSDDLVITDNSKVSNKSNNSNARDSKKKSKTKREEDDDDDQIGTTDGIDEDNVILNGTENVFNDKDPIEDEEVQLRDEIKTIVDEIVDGVIKSYDSAITMNYGEEIISSSLNPISPDDMMEVEVEVESEVKEMESFDPHNPSKEPAAAINDNETELTEKSLMMKHEDVPSKNTPKLITNNIDKRYKSYFDFLRGTSRCCLCGIQSGIALRCAAAACTVRAHPLCVSIAGPDWVLCSVSSISQTDSPSTSTSSSATSTGDLNIHDNITQNGLTYFCCNHIKDKKE